MATSNAEELTKGYIKATRPFNYPVAPRGVSCLSFINCVSKGGEEGVFRSTHQERKINLASREIRYVKLRPHPTNPEVDRKGLDQLPEKGGFHQIRFGGRIRKQYAVWVTSGAPWGAGAKLRDDSLPPAEGEGFTWRKFCDIHRL